MSFAYDSDLEPTDEDLTSELGDEYDSFFDDEDYLSLGYDPAQPTDAKPGSEEKVLMLAARYASGLPLWHTEDRYDHGPGQVGVVDPSIASDFQLDEDE